MNDTTIQEHIKKFNLDSLVFEHMDLGRKPYVVCVFNPLYQGLVAIQATGDSQDTALQAVLNFHAKLTPLWRFILPPNLSEQTYEDGYCHKALEFKGTAYEVSFKRRGNRFVIVSLRRTAPDGFFFVDEPFAVPADWQFVAKVPAGDLYTWDNIGFLSGSAGEAIVVEGKVTQTRTTAIA